MGRGRGYSLPFDTTLSSTGWTDRMQSGDSTRQLIIDSHCHAGKGDGLTGPWDTDASINNFMQWSKEAGIDKTVIFAAFNSDYEKANKKVGKLVIKYPEKFYGYAFVNALNDRGRIFEMLWNSMNKYKFCGIKVHRYDARISREICEAAKYFHLPVLYDVMGEISAVDLIAKEYPGVNFIIPHLGSFAEDWKAQKSFIDKLVLYKNIYTDSSGVRNFELFQEAFERAGAHKILFGSDGPWIHPGVELEKIYSLKSSKKELELMLSGNFLRLTTLARHSLATEKRKF
jgi:predicted TIM-barrel fold metal-dependent hydrolase